MLETTYCGYIAIVGRPNVGKSTLLNNILGQKISIVSRKPQTTRYKILGIKTENNRQAIYIDTPGISKKNKHPLNSYLYKAALSALHEASIIIFMVDGYAWYREEEQILTMLKNLTCPIIFVINKIDCINDKNTLLPYLAKFKDQKFAAMIPISAKSGINIPDLEKQIMTMLPEGPLQFPAEKVTDRDMNFLVAETVREKLTRLLGQEVPHELMVVVEKVVAEDSLIRISAVIYVERQGQKLIVIGKSGEKLKEVGSKARVELEKMFKKKVFLQLWVKVKTGWSSNPQDWQKMGLDNLKI